MCQSPHRNVVMSGVKFDLMVQWELPFAFIVDLMDVQLEPSESLLANILTRCLSPSLNDYSLTTSST